MELRSTENLWSKWAVISRVIEIKKNEHSEVTNLCHRTTTGNN